MSDRDPLQLNTFLPQTILNQTRNARGRPATRKVLVFSPQPQSIVSQLLSKIRAEEVIQINTNVKTTEPEEDNSSVLLERETVDNNDNFSYSSDEKELKVNDLTDTEETESKDDLEICEVCSYRAPDIKKLKQHLKSHKQFTCDFPNCKYICKLSSNLFKHKRIHTDEKPFLCDQCSFRSNFVNSLKVHKRIHTSERPYQCSHCIYRCNTSSNLKKHCLHRHRDIINTSGGLWNEVSKNNEGHFEI